MKYLLMTTIMASALAAAPAYAQTATPLEGAPPGLPAPEGFQQQTTVLTADDLMGATIYDVNGSSIGDVRDLVLDIVPAGGNALDSGTTAAPDAGSAATPPGAGSMTGTDMSPETPGGATGSIPPAGDTGQGATTLPDSTAARDQTGADTGTTVPGQTGTDMDTTAPGQTGAASGTVSNDGAAISHAVLDIGGFLGIGQHRVAVPVSDLTVFSDGNNIRVYLPWTRDQLEALPTYDAANPATLGQVSRPVAN